MNGRVQWAALAPRILLEPLRGSGVTGPADTLARADATAPAAAASAVRPVALSDPGQPPLTPQPGTHSHPGTRAEISSNGKLLASLAGPRLAGGERGRAVPATLLALIDAPSDGFARELRTSFERSGLFYEAHLRAWNSGEFSLADLKLEPQARFGAAHPAAVPVPLASHVAWAAPALAAQAPEPEQGPPARAPADAPPPRPAIAPELEPLVREQLATLESRVAVVPLLVWPGQSALFEVGEEPGRENAAAGPAGERAWRATLSLALPRLGAARFVVALQGDAVRIRAEATCEASGIEFGAASPQLRAALEANALRLEQLEVLVNGR